MNYISFLVLQVSIHIIRTAGNIPPFMLHTTTTDYAMCECGIQQGGLW